MLASEVFDKCAEEIGKPGAWCQDSYARDKHGVDCPADCPDAVCWCQKGIVCKLKPLSNFCMETIPLRAICRVFPDGDFGGIWNDAPNRTQEEVVAKFRELAAVARELERENH